MAAAGDRQFASLYEKVAELTSFSVAGTIRLARNRRDVLERVRTTPPARGLRLVPPGYVKPCAPTVLGRPPCGPGWTHEIKQDGYRIIARKDPSGAVHLWTRDQDECSGRFATIAVALRALPVTSCTLDGEAVARRPDGHADYQALRSLAGAADAVLIAFDLLELNGSDLRREPLEERRAMLSALCEEAIVFSESFAADGALVFEHACKLGLEGIVSKRRGTTYQSGPSSNWVTTLCPGYERAR